MPTLPELFAQTVADHADQVALRWQPPADGFAASAPGPAASASGPGGDYAERVARVAAALREPGCGARRPGRAHDAEPAGVPHRRYRGAAARRDTDLDLQLLRAGTGAVPRRALRGVGRDRRGHRVPRALPQGAQRTARAASRRDHRRPRAPRAGRRPPVGRTARRGAARPSTPSSATRGPTIS